MDDPAVQTMWREFGSPRADQSLLDRFSDQRPGPWGFWPFYVLLAALFGIAKFS